MEGRIKPDRWRKIIEVIPKHKLPSLVGREDRYIEPRVVLEGDIEVHPKNPNLEIRDVGE